MQNKNLSHANIFIGGEKACLAWIGEMLSDLKITSADRHDFSSAQTITIAEVRQLLKSIIFAPHSSPHKVVIVPAQRLNLEAAQALLKSIEEPPGHTIWFLYAENEKSVPATIVSRCQRIYIGKYSILSQSHKLKEISDWPLERRFEFAVELSESGFAPQALDQWLIEAHTIAHLGRKLSLMQELLEIKKRLQSNTSVQLQLESFFYNLET